MLAICGSLVYTVKEWKTYVMIYEGIYDIVASRMREAGKEFAYQKSTFLCDVGSPPQNIDVARFLELENHQFYEAVHVAVFRRLPEEKEAEPWEKKEQLPKEQFQREVLESIAHSTVAAINQVRLIHNPYFRQRRGLKYRCMGYLYGLTDKSSLREFGKKLPWPIQRVIRKVFL